MSEHLSDQAIDYPTPALDSLVKAVLMAVALSIVLGVAFFCMPDKSSVVKDFQKFGRIVRRMAGTGHAAAQAATQAQVNIKRCISYNDPRIKSTLDLPWAR